MATAFQVGAFQSNAFQSGYQVVAGDYSLGSPTFGTPAIGTKYVFSTSSYWLGSPAFATPTLTTGSSFDHVNANPYSLGSPAFATPTARMIHRLNAALAYALGSPVFVAPVLKQNQHFVVNAAALGSPVFATPAYRHNYSLTGTAFAISTLAYGSPMIGSIATLVASAPYSLGSPTFGFPRMTWQVVSIGLPPSYLSQIDDATGMLGDLLTILVGSLPATVTKQTNDARRLIRLLRETAAESIRDNTVGQQLQDIYLALRAANASYQGIEAARQFLMGQVASRSVFTQTIFRHALLMTLALECATITVMKFRTRDDAQKMILHVSSMFEDAKALAIDEIDVLVFQAVNALGGTTVNFLANTALQLPRFVEYNTKMPMPSLYLAQRIYLDASRSDEIEEENGVVNPCFMPTSLRVLSNVGY